MASTPKLVAAAATVTLGSSLAATAPPSARAATPECGPGCVSIFTPAFGTMADPGYVEAVLDGEAEVGQPLVLRRASGTDTSADLKPRPGRVSSFYAAGKVSAAVNHHYGDLNAAQIEYAPAGVASDLCVGLARPARQGLGLTLQPCSTPGTTVWIVDTRDSPDTGADDIAPLVNGSTTNFARPYAMTYPRKANPGTEAATQIVVRHLRVRCSGAVPERQLWGLRFGVLD